MEPNKTLTNSKDIFSEERMDALADVLAEGFLYLAENGLLDNNTEVPPETNASTSVSSDANKLTE